MRFRICIVALVLVMTTDVDAIPTITSAESPSVALGGVPARSNESVSFRQLQSHYSTPGKNGRRDTYTLSGHNYICRVIGDTLCDADIGDAFTVGEVMAVGRCLLRLRRFLGVIWVRLVWNYGLGTSGCRMARLQIHKPRRAVHERALEKAFSRGHDVSVPTATTVATALIFEVHL